MAERDETGPADIAAEPARTAGLSTKDLRFFGDPAARILPDGYPRVRRRRAQPSVPPSWAALARPCRPDCARLGYAGTSGDIGWVPGALVPRRTHHGPPAAAADPPCPLARRARVPGTLARPAGAVPGDATLSHPALLTRPEPVPARRGQVTRR